LQSNTVSDPIFYFSSGTRYFPVTLSGFDGGPARFSSLTRQPAPTSHQSAILATVDDVETGSGG
jgi:hypothetical protein